MNRFLILIALFTVFSAASSVKEWKNFENGKVYSHKIPGVLSDVQEPNPSKEPEIKEKILHSHRRDKKLKNNPMQATGMKERHHKKSVEEEMHLRPLNERHHKFPNPALLDKYSDPSISPHISRQDYLKQRAKPNNRRRQRGRRLKRNKSVAKIVIVRPSDSPPRTTTTMLIPQQSQPTSQAQKIMRSTKSEEPMKMPSYW